MTVTRATGAIRKIASHSKEGAVKEGMPNHAASRRGVMSTLPKNKAVRYPVLTANKIGIILKIPRQNTTDNTATPKVMSVRSQFLSAIFIATGARLKPITIITGPVTIGGNNFLILL